MEEALIKRVMPHSPEAEQSVIGSMIMDTEAILAASETITSDDFYQKQYGVLFDAMVELYNEGKPVDLVTLQDRLKQKDVPPEIAGLEFLRDIIDSTYTSTNVRQYAQIVRDKAILRRLIRTNEDIAGACADQGDRPQRARQNRARFQNQGKRDRHPHRFYRSGL